MSQKRRKRTARACLVHALRVMLVIALLMLIPAPQKPIDLADVGDAPSLDAIQTRLPSAAAVDEQPNSSGLWIIRDDADQPIALAARTLPAAGDIVGYRGPTEALVLLDNDLIVTSISLLQSTDTTEHVDAVIKDEIFFEQFKGWPWGGPAGDAAVDAVSGATLTSLALAEGVLKRIGGERPSLVFPKEVTLEEVSDWYPNAASVDNTADPAKVLDQSGKKIGSVLRSGIFSDDIAGYQGPTEMLLKIDDEDKVERIRIRSSFDNEPYVDYVRTEFGFWAIFQGKTLTELAEFNPEAEGVEGVSGATMTSLAVADTLVAAVRAAREQQSEPRPEAAKLPAVRWSAADFGTIACLVLVGVFSQLRWFRVRWFRRLWLVGVIVVVGLWAGNLISMSLVAGWSAQGIAWRLAPGLSAIAAVAMIMPPISKGNPYCNHLCPHGALQQLVKPNAKSKRRIRLGKRITKALGYVPGLTLAIAYIALILRPTIDLSSWEPFHAYLYSVAGWTAFALAIGTLIAAMFIPMAYCRFGCPTGTLLDYLRRKATSDRIQKADMVASALLVLALFTRFGSG